MKYDDQDRAIALAGIYQAATLVQQIARRGMADTQAMGASIHSIFQIDAESVADVYGGLSGIGKGLRAAYHQLLGEVKRDNELTSYLLSLIQLERKLTRRTDRLDRIHAGIQETRAKLTHFPEIHSNILASLADIYAQNISTLQPRIMVSGEPVYLQNPDNVNKIRSLLFAGIRSAMLWRQTGGRRRQLLLTRKTYIKQTNLLLNRL
ncbi:MAG: high frequency lysogenization protein HflD [Gammaproteobacteria bacterium]|nr:high frequency lysogenization protein HflD [Gammaproteobacteria bacterium]